MARLTITLSDARYRALKETAARRGKTIGAMIEECLDRAGIKTVAGAADLVAQARQRSRLSEGAALALAIRETRATRRRRR
jgi:predicted DNA-binding ribbon-helix-helix protein